MKPGDDALMDADVAADVLALWTDSKGAVGGTDGRLLEECLSVKVDMRARGGHPEWCEGEAAVEKLAVCVSSLMML